MWASAGSMEEVQPPSAIGTYGACTLKRVCTASYVAIKGEPEISCQYLSSLSSASNSLFHNVFQANRREISQRAQ